MTLETKIELAKCRLKYSELLELTFGKNPTKLRWFKFQMIQADDRRTEIALQKLEEVQDDCEIINRKKIKR